MSKVLSIMITEYTHAIRSKAFIISVAGIGPACSELKDAQAPSFIKLFRWIFSK